MRSMFSNLGRFSVAIVTFLVMFSLLAVYLFIYVPSQRDYFTKRNLRILNVMSTQIKSKIENFGGVIHNIVDDIASDIESSAAIAIVRQRIALVPDLTLKGNPKIKDNDESEDADHNKRHEIDLHAQLEGNHYTLHFEYTGHFGEKKLIAIHASSNLDEILAPIVERGEFDDFLVVQMKPDTIKGRKEEEAIVIYQKGSSELSIAKFDTLEDSRGRKFLFNSQINNSNVKDIRLLGTDYKLLLQPFAITLHQGEMESEQIEKWVLVGLIETNRFNSESRAISKHLVFLFFLLVVIAILCLPIIKVKFIGPKDRLKLVDIGLLGYSLLIAVSLITISTLNLYSYLATQIGMDNQLKELAAEIKTEFRGEVQQALAQLDKFEYELMNTKLTNKKDGSAHQHGRREENIFEEGKVDAGDPYPFFEMVFWTNKEGEQKIKWSIRDQTTALINVKRRNYFNNIKRERLWQLHDSTGTAITPQRFILEPIYSLTTGQNAIILAIPDTANQSIKISNSDLNLNAVYLEARFASIVKPVIPVGQGFAIIENDGKVLFHSDEKRNLRENFFEECDNIEPLKAFVFGHTEDYLDVKYMGRDHRLFVTPLRDLPWTLVTFRDQEIFRTINIELITMAIGMFLAYLLLFSVFVLLIWVTISLLRRLRRSPRQDYFWLWPEYGKRGIYSFAIVVFVILNLLFGYRILYFDIDEVLYATGVLPFLGSILFYMLIKEPSHSSVVRVPFKSLWKKEATKVIVPSSSFDARFVGLIICLITLVGVLPSLAFFKIAHKMEIDLLVKHRQLKFAEAIEAREDRIKKDYDHVKFVTEISKKSFLEQRLALNDSPEPRMASKDIVLTQQFREFDIYGKFDSLGYHKRGDDNPADEGSEHLHPGFERELAHMMLLNNQTTIEVRELIHDQSDDMLWHWVPDEKGGMLTLHKRGYYDDRCLVVSSVLPPFWTAFESGPKWWGAFRILLGVLIFIVAIGLFVLIRLIVRKLFLTDFALTESPSANVRLSNSLLVNPPDSVKEKLFGDKDVHALDLIEIAKEENWSDSYPYSQLPSGKTIAINHFEHKKSDAGCNSEKVRFLEELVYTHKRDVVLISNIDPANFQFADGEGESAKSNGGAQNGAHSVFTVFQKNLMLDYGDPGALSDEYLAAKKELMKIPGKRKRKHCIEICDLLYNECFPTAELNKIGLEMLNERDFVYLDRSELIDNVRERAYTYYRKIWLTCSKEERLALVYLAKDGFANLTNRQVIQNLLRSGLIIRHPGFRLMNESFKKFVLEEGGNQEVIKWAKQSSTSSWGKVKMPLIMVLAGVLVFLFSTQPSAFKSTISIISAVTAGIPTLIKILGSLKFGRAGAAVEA